MFECPNCKNKSLIWGADYNAEDLAIASDGVASALYCENKECNVHVHQIHLYNEDAGIEYHDTLIEYCYEDDNECEVESMIAWANLYDRIHDNYFTKFNN